MSLPNSANSSSIRSVSPRDRIAVRTPEEARRDSEERLRDSRERIEVALSAGEIATWTWDVVNDCIVADANLARLFSVDPQTAAGGTLDSYMATIHPDDRARVFESISGALSHRSDYEAEYRVVLPDGSVRWLVARGKVERDSGGKTISMPGVAVDITARVGRERFLTELAERARALTDPDEVIADAVRSVGMYLGVDRCAFADVDTESDTITVHSDYRVDDTATSIAGVYQLSAFIPFLSTDLSAGDAVVMDDVRDDTLKVPLEYVARCEALGIRAHVAVPVIHASRVVSGIGVQSATPRHWKSEEVALLQTIAERTWLTVEVARQQRALRQEVEHGREQGEYLRRILESSPDCIKTLDLDGHVLTMNEGGQAVMEVEDFGAICGVDWLTFWGGETQDALRVAIETAKAGGMGRFQGLCPTMKGSPRWWDVVVAPILGADGKPEQLLGVSRDITDQKVAGERERARLTNIFMQAPAFMAALRGPEHVFELANLPYRQLIGQRDIIGKSVASALPELEEQGFIGLLDQVYRTGESFVGRDRSILLQVNPADPLEEHFVDFSYQPLFGEDGIVSGILVHGVDLTERKRLEQEREGLLADARANAEREKLLNRIGAAVRTTLEPQDILRAAVSILGEGLRADRCYFVRYDQTRDTARVFPEWHRAEAKLEPLTGRTFQMSTYSVDRDPAYKAGSMHVVDDVVTFAPEDAAPLLALDIRSLVRVPIEVGDQMTALAVGMAYEPRHWTEDELRLMENVASLVRSTLESAHVQQRERNIANQLQAALLPPPPPHFAGFSLASFYRPALAEAGVGGDFFDVFEVEKDCTALVVADLSGKGLAAASQVATVKNMLRYALYSGDTVADAVTGLHRVLVEHELLSGFATLFVGLYDHVEQTVDYVNCGQEPGLVWHAATGTVEILAPTGPILGGFEWSDKYSQKTVNLLPGDVIALFTDGLTEVGPSRKELLEVEGVSGLLRACCADATQTNTPQSVVDCLIAGVDGYARGGVRDDIALLVGVIPPDTSESRETNE
ncbi:MAG: SpoIIE family protein phosphatase [Fibrella sp.]|nr:SpoIIE family protein phosphatase [Armatimonadota bacterium]